LPIPKEYHGREQAYVKHTILKTYLQCLFMIIGRKETVINYVDCFAGPWAEESDDLKDTSIGISLRQMRECAETLKSKFGANVKFRALYIEKDKKAFAKLEAFLAGNKQASVEASCIQGDYTTKIDDIVQWASGNFTFFFIDPKGWKTVISAPVLAPLLALNKVEFLINLMYDFFNRAMSMKSHQADVEELLGRSVVLTGNETSSERQSLVIAQYREVIGDLYDGKTAYVSVERPGMERVLYFLVYLTRHPLGIIKFKQAAEEMEMVQRVSHFESKMRAQISKSPIDDLFGSDQALLPVEKSKDNRLAAKEFLLTRLSKKPLLIDYDCWSEFLIHTDYYPTDLQLAFKELAKEGRILNLDANIARRSKFPVKPDWPRKSERWILND
jgi:three-Cys-motif partner protein